MIRRINPSAPPYPPSAHFRNHPISLPHSPLPSPSSSSPLIGLFPSPTIAPPSPSAEIIDRSNDDPSSYEPPTKGFFCCRHLCGCKKRGNDRSLLPERRKCSSRGSRYDHEGNRSLHPRCSSQICAANKFLKSPNNAPPMISTQNSALPQSPSPHPPPILPPSIDSYPPNPFIANYPIQMPSLPLLISSSTTLSPSMGKKEERWPIHPPYQTPPPMHYTIIHTPYYYSMPLHPPMQLIDHNVTDRLSPSSTVSSPPLTPSSDDHQNGTPTDTDPSTTQKRPSPSDKHTLNASDADQPSPHKKLKEGTGRSERNLLQSRLMISSSPAALPLEPSSPHSNQRPNEMIDPRIKMTPSPSSGDDRSANALAFLTKAVTLIK